MATASLGRVERPTTLSGRELSLTAFEVRVWGMDGEGKPFIQTATARHITEKGAQLTGVLPVQVGDTIGIKYLDRKSRFKITWLSDQDCAQTRSIGVECLEEKSIWGMRIPIPIEHHSSAYADSTAAGSRENRRKAERYNCRVAADVTLDNAVAQAHAWVSDISHKGCYLQMIAPFPVGSGVALSVYASDLKHSQPLVLRGTVRTCHPMVGMGVEFVDVSEADLRGIQTVLGQLGGAKTKDSQSASAAWTSAPSSNLVPAWAPTLAVSLADEHFEPHVVAKRLCSEIGKLERGLGKENPRALAELRQAALHMRNVWHLSSAAAQNK